MTAFYMYAGVVIAVLSYIPLTYQVWFKGLSQNFATFVLWGVLDSIAAGSIAVKGGNFGLPLIYVICCGGVLLGLLRNREFKWGRIEWVTSGLVVLSMVAWFFVDSRWATVISSIAMAISISPQWSDSWKKPFVSPVWTYSAFTLANGLSIFGGKNWSIEERFYATACTVTTILFVIMIFLRRRHLRGNLESGSQPT